MNTSPLAKANTATPLVKSVSNDILNSIARHIRTANAALAQLVLVAPRERRQYRRRSPVKIPAPLAARMQRTPKVPKAVKVPNPDGRHYLSEEEKKDIALLLERTSISVSVIASMFLVSRAAIYNLRDRLNIDARKGSPALMAGVRRLHAQRNKPIECQVALIWSSTKGRFI